MASPEEMHWNDRITHQNTFRLDPKKRFDTTKIKVNLTNIMNMNLNEVEYSDQVMRDLCMTISEEVIAAIKADNYERYRIVVVVNIGEKKMQGERIEHGFLWDARRDRYVEHLYETNAFFAQTIVYAIYTD